MATSPVPLWAQEMSPHHHGPTAGGVLCLAVVAVLLACCCSSPADHRAAGDRSTRPGCLAVRGAPALARSARRRPAMAGSYQPRPYRSGPCCPASPPDATSPGRTSRRPSGSPGRSSGAPETGARGGKEAPTAPATTAAASVAPASEHPSQSRAIPLPIPPRAPEGVPTASTAHSRRSGLPSPGVVRKKRGRLPGSLWCGCSRLDERVRPAGEEKRPANPGRAAIGGLAVRVQGRVLGIDPDPSAPRPSAAPYAPQAVAR